MGLLVVDQTIERFVRDGQNIRAEPDEQAARWLATLRPGARARDLGPLPVFGYPGWADNERAEFYIPWVLNPND